MLALMSLYIDILGQILKYYAPQVRPDQGSNS